MKSMIWNPGKGFHAFPRFGFAGQSPASPSRLGSRTLLRRAGVVWLAFAAMVAPGCKQDAAQISDNGGSQGKGGSQGSGGARASGGALASGGARSSASGGAGESGGAGGSRGSGGATSAAGTQGAGGQNSAGGAQGEGGAQVQSSGGSQTNGGTQSRGGSQGGGSPSTGGRQGGGVTAGGAGGSSGTSGSPDAAADAPIGQGDASDAQGSQDLRAQAARPAVGGDACGAWAATEGVCCAQYCSNDNTSESCDKCGGPGSAQCQVVNAKACTSGQWPEVHSVSDNEDWHYSRSTHFGTAPTGACAFGLYGICSNAMTLANANLQKQCDSFCQWYPDLCKDPTGTTLRGNFAAPQGNYYTQFWSSLPGDLDNYLSCGECFELERTQDDGTELQSGAGGYTPPIVLQVADSCPCSANSKWCCGSGRDHCGEVEGTFQYGCPLPPIPPPPPNHDPQTNESMHLDLSDIAMARLQTGDPNGNISDGVIPTKYKRVPCPVVGNIHIWLRSQGSVYYFAMTVVNVGGLGSVAQLEAQLPSGDWLALERDKNYSLSRPQERFGTWATPQGKGPFALPITLRITDGGGRSVVAQDVIKSFTPSDSSQSENWFIDTGIQF